MNIKAKKQYVPYDKRKLCIPCWYKECEAFFRTTQASSSSAADLAASSLIERLDKNRQTRWKETVKNIDFTQSSRKAWRTINRLTGRARQILGERLITANAIVSQLHNNTIRVVLSITITVLYQRWVTYGLHELLVGLYDNRNMCQ